MTASNVPKIADFGLSIHSFSNTKHTYGVGTQFYTASEVNLGHYNEKADIFRLVVPYVIRAFSLGVVFFEVFLSFHVTGGDAISMWIDEFKTVTRFLSTHSLLQSQSFPPVFLCDAAENTFSNPVKNFLQPMVAPAAKRPTTAQLIEALPDKETFSIQAYYENRE